VARWWPFTEATQRARRAVITAGVVGLLALPVLIDRDDFPLSTYPMYSRTRSSEVSFVTANGLDAAGERRRLGLDVIGASDDPLVVAGELRADVRAGRTDERCRAMLARLPADDEATVAVEVVTERHDTVEHAAGRSSLIERTVHVRCVRAEDGR
jgi:hypothetical protein